jgi:membrane-associated phospholipid phosphatase
VRRSAGLAALVATALVASLLLDAWAWHSLVDLKVYEADWGRLLRVVGSIYLWIPLALVVWLELRIHAPDRAGRGGLLLLAPALAGGVAEVIKILVRRERPALHDGAYYFRPFGERPFSTPDIGFPSSHAMVAFAGAAIVARLFPRTAPVAYFLAAACGLSRVLSHAHFLSDAVGGAIAGWAVGALLWTFVTRRTGTSEARPAAT